LEGSPQLKKETLHASPISNMPVPQQPSVVSTKPSYRAKTGERKLESFDHFMKMKAVKVSNFVYLRPKNLRN